MAEGWQQLYEDWSWARGQDAFPIPAYSEFMPAPRIGQKPYGSWDLENPFAADDPFGWRVGEAELERELRPGLANIAHQLLRGVLTLATGKGVPRVGHRHLAGNPYWPAILAQRSPAQERIVFLAPLALSKTQDDKGRVRWTLFGGSHLGPARGFWASFYSAPGRERPVLESQASILKLLKMIYGETADDMAAAGFRVLPTGPLEHGYDDGELPSWTAPLLLNDDEPVARLRYLLTFRPFAHLPEAIQQAYFQGQLRLLPSPGTLVYWGSPLYRQLESELPFAGQALLLQAVARHSNPRGIRVPQSGWLKHAAHNAHDAGLGEAKTHYRRTHRWQRSHRDEDSAAFAREDHLHTVLFSNHPDDVGLYGKPMARNAQIWSEDFRAVLHGPRADGEAIKRAIQRMANGRSFGYRFFFPPMQAGRHTVFWHRPLIAFYDPESGQERVLESDIAGFLSAHDATQDEASALAFWPRLGRQDSEGVAQARPGARRADRADSDFRKYLGVAGPPVIDPGAALTFKNTASRNFEVRYWKTIAKLAEGRYLNKNSADCAKDKATQSRLPWYTRDLELLGDFLLDHYRKRARQNSVPALVGEMPFRWRTDFEFSWMDGWRLSQSGEAPQRNIVVVIPGENRNEAVIMADHYDTAYMEDVYGYRSGKNNGARLAACGADDNHSATAALMLGADIFMSLSRERKLKRDVWIVHLTGEEFPSDCLGARHLAQSLVEGNCKITSPDGGSSDLSRTTICGVYVLDMIAHNNDKRRDVFQIAPGPDKGSLWLAFHAHAAAQMWAAGTSTWNAAPSRRDLEKGRRTPHGSAVPVMAKHLAPHGEVRFQDDPRSTLFNTDGQIFADAGIPTVLFMENYDINREGYHDQQDTMANIDLDYGAAIAAIAIESVARAATQPLP
ncbi:MAG TPA: M28 family peptidase [Rhizomicrobium sp.]|nr:M28 family peptidase [Rhizomicrobium sp.]